MNNQIKLLNAIIDKLDIKINKMLKEQCGISRPIDEAKSDRLKIDILIILSRIFEEIKKDELEK